MAKRKRDPWATPPLPPEPLLTVRQVATQLNITTATLYRYLYGGHLPYLRLPGTGRRHIRLRPGDVEAWIDAHLSSAQASRDPASQGPEWPDGCAPGGS